MKDIGRQLRAKRDELGLTLEEIQAETKIRRRYLEALEIGKVDLIPGEVYVKGFLRFYANFLGLDGQALVKEYNAAKEAQAAGADGAAPVARPAPGAAPVAARASSQASWASLPISATGPPLKATQGSRNGRFGRLLVYALVIVLLVIAAGVYYTWSHAQSAPGGETGAGQGGSPPVAGGATSGGSGDGSSGSAGSDSGSTGGGSGGSAVSKPHWAVVSESDALVGHVVYGTPFTVCLEVVAETCWIRIRVDGETVLEKTLDAGAKVEWTAKSSLAVVLGRPQLVKVGVDGQPLGLAGTRDEPRTLTFEAASPPSGGEGAGGA